MIIPYKESWWKDQIKFDQIKNIRHTISAASRVMDSIFYKFIRIGLYDAIKIWIHHDS